MTQTKPVPPASGTGSGNKGKSGSPRYSPSKPRRKRLGQTGATIPISSIKLGRRHRLDLGDVAALAANMDEVGLLHPVVVRRDGTLIAGARRIAAAKKLGLETIPATISDLDDTLRGEVAENAFRKALTLSEAVAAAEALEAVERKAAKARQAAAGPASGRGKKATGVANFAEPVRGRALDKMAKALGMSRTTLQRAQAIVTTAKAFPGEFDHLVAAMDRTGRVNGVFRRLKNTQQAAIIKREAPPLPGRGPYRALTCDVPWPYEVRDEDPSKRGVRPYPSMSIEEIKSFGQQVQKILHDDCIMWFWTTNYHMRFAFDVLDVWGLEAKTILTWVKNRMGNGDWLRSQTEHCIMATRGRPTVTLTNQTTVLNAPMRAHSQKPREFYDMVERLCPAPRYADLFSRYQHNDRWDCHGDQAPPMLTTEKKEDAA